MPFPSTMRELIAAGYRHLDPRRCPDCGQQVGPFTTPGGREIVINLMTGPDSPVVRHFETCKPQKTPIVMRSVADRNMVAVGWMDGTLEVWFKSGRYRFTNVPEDVFVKIANPRQPYPNNIFTKLVKNHPELYPFTKVG